MLTTLLTVLLLNTGEPKVLPSTQPSSVDQVSTTRQVNEDIPEPQPGDQITIIGLRFRITAWDYFCSKQVPLICFVFTLPKEPIEPSPEKSTRRWTVVAPEQEGAAGFKMEVSGISTETGTYGEEKLTGTHVRFTK